MNPARQSSLRILDIGAGAGATINADVSESGQVAHKGQGMPRSFEKMIMSHQILGHAIFKPMSHLQIGTRKLMILW